MQSEENERKIPRPVHAIIHVPSPRMGEETGGVTLGGILELPARTARTACTARQLGEMSRNDRSLAGSGTGLNLKFEVVRT